MLRPKLLYLKILVLMLLPVNSSAQDFMNDSLFLKCDFLAMDTMGILDSFDIIQGDSLDYLDYSDNNAGPEFPWLEKNGKYCRQRQIFQPSSSVDLLQRDWHYIRIYYDDFNYFDKAFWQNENLISNGYRNWDKFVNFPNNQTTSGALMLNEMESVENGKLVIRTKYRPTTLKWSGDDDKNAGYYDPYSNKTKTWDYVTARVESSFAFDGCTDIVDGNFGEEEGGLMISAKIKHPTDKWLLPAYWFVNFNDPYEELDVFEYFNQSKEGDQSNNYRNMSVHMYSEDNYPDRTCHDNYLLKDPYNFRLYSYFWNSFHIAVYNDEKTKSVFQRHQYSRDNRIFFWPTELKVGNKYNKRNRYNKNAMRINFSTAVYNGIFNEPNPNLDAKMEVDYIAVFKKMPCAQNEVFDNINDLNIKHGIFNVKIAKKATFNIDLNDVLTAGEMFKLITNDVVDILKINAANDFTLIIEHVNHDLCSDMFIVKNKSVPDGTDDDYISDSLESEQVTYDWDKLSMKITENADENLKVEVYDIQGRLLSRCNSIELKDLKFPAQGLYFIHEMNIGVGKSRVYKLFYRNE